MNSVDFENKILDAIDTVVDNKVSNAGYNKTIRGVISSIEDSIEGRYLVKYQDSEIEAYSNNNSVKYTKGTLVDILVPNGDFRLDKVILGAVDKNNVEYNTVLEDDEQYEIEGGNVLATTQEFGLCSYHSEDIIYLYSRDNGINDINYDRLAFEENVKNNNKILCGAKFRTDFDAIQKRLGNFGVVFEIEFKDNVTGTILTKSYKIDVNRMYGTPYDQINPTRQYGIFQINNENFESVKSIYIFSNNFPIIDETKDRYDIFVSDFELCSIRSLTEAEKAGYSLSLFKGGKGYFDETNLPTDTMTISAKLKMKNKVVTTEADYYWFIENNNITLDSKDYINYGGEGWECINKYNEISATEKMLLTDSMECEISREQCGNTITNIKCVAVKDGGVLASRIISVYNYDPNHVITIVSDQGAQFYFDNGNPTLTCKVDGVENNSYNYYWTSTDVNGETIQLEDTIEDNAIYNAAKDEYDVLVAKIETGTAMAAANQERLNELKTIIDSYEYKQRVEENKIIHVDLTQITEQTTFKCMVKKDGRIIGTAEIIIKNTLGVEGEYKLNIINGTQVFSYDSNGVSPASESLEKPIIVKPLSFEIVDNLGNKFNDLILSTCDVQWEVPQSETMLIGQDSKELRLTYKIADKYDYKKLNNNNIRLSVTYKNLHLETHTEFTFAKDGDPGTNATGVVCKIVPNSIHVLDGYPMLVNGVPNFTPVETGKWFKVQLWENGEKIFDSVDGDSSHGVSWSILKNIYTRNNSSNIADPTSIAVSGSTFSYTGYRAPAANIIKVQVTYKGNTYYCTYPLIIADVTTDYNIELIENSGFRYVIYASNGKRPQYDNTRPFTLKVTKVIDGYVEDITNIANSYKPTYSWECKGQIFNVNSDSFVDNINLSIANRSGLTGNQKFLIPNEDFTGECVNNAVEVKFYDSNSTEVGKILIPIHMYLDKYGISALNGWDGNKISINNDTGAILAPQVGAGKKESDNTFTGVLMGSVKERGSDTTDQGLFGFSHGQRSIFLDANSGKAEFGIKSKGRIILDPTNGAKIYGGGYETNPNTGLLIDLATPEIKFGNGNFSVNSNGHLTAKGGGSIASWSIGNTTLSSEGITINSNGSISGDGQGGGTWSINRGLATFHNITATNGTIGAFDLSTSGISSGSGNSQAGMGVYGQKYAFWAGSEDTGNAPFHVGHGGDLHATGASISGTISTDNLTATSGKIGNWNISSGSIKYNNYIYLGSNGDVRFGSANYYISMGTSTNHPAVSGLNVEKAGIVMNGHGISKCSGLTGQSDVVVTSDAELSLTGKTLRIRATDGLGQVAFLKGGGGSGFTGLDLYNAVKREEGWSCWSGDLRVRRVDEHGRDSGYYYIVIGNKGLITSVTPH